MGMGVKIPWVGGSIYWIGILPMVFWHPYPWYFDHPYPWYIEPPTHGISTPLTMVFWPHYPWYFDPPTHGISNPLPMVFWPPYQWYFNPPYLWYIKPSLMVLWTPLLVEMRGGSIYHEGVQNTMTKNWPRGQNTIRKIEPGVKIS